MSDDRKLSDIGNELHNLSCHVVHHNEDWANQLGALASELWNWSARAQLPSQGGEAVEVVPEGKEFSQFLSAVMDAAGLVRHGRQSKELSEYLGSKCMEYMLSATPAQPDQCAHDLTMVKVSRELLQDLRDLAFDQVEHHRAAMGAYKQTRQSAMDSALAQADALLEVKP